MIYWGDERGQHCDHVSGTSLAPVGETPVIRATGQCFGCKMILAITSKGAVAFMVFRGKFPAPVFAWFLKRLLKQLEGRVHLIVDRHPVHRSGEVRRFAEQNQAPLRLIRIRGYCSELNSAELLNQDAKTNGFGKSRAANRGELMGGVRWNLYRRQTQHELIRNQFQEEHVRYAAQ